MALFEPGRLHLQHAALQPQDVAYELNLHYKVLDDASRGKYVHFTIAGNINAKPFEEEFELGKDAWYNFASRADHVARKNGLPATCVLAVSLHRQYDAVFEDIRQRIGAQSGDAVSTEHVDAR